MSFVNRLLKAGMVIGLAASVVFGFAQAADTDPISKEAKQDVLTRLQQTLEKNAFVPGVSFDKWPEMVKAHQKELDEAKTVSEFANKVNSIISQFGFSHIVFFPPSYGVARMTQQRAGIGIRVEIEPEGIRVADVFPESPAAEVGLRAGDLIIEADGKPTRQVGDLAGNVGDESNLTFIRGSEKRQVKVVRRMYKTVIPESLSWNGSTAILRVPSFDASYDRANVEKLMAEIDKKATAIILDLRGNGGGRVVNLQHLGSYFLNRREQPMGTFIGRMQIALYERNNEPTSDLVKIANGLPDNQRVRVSSNSTNTLFKLPVAVLIDGASGSASEMMAAAMREQLNAKVYGRKSAGAVLASVIVPLNDENKFWVQFPLTDYITIKGVRLEGNGVTPDFETKPRVFGQPDEALEAAVREMAVHATRKAS